MKKSIRSQHAAAQTWMARARYRQETLKKKHRSSIASDMVGSDDETGRESAWRGAAGSTRGLRGTSHVRKRKERRRRTSGAPLRR